VGVVLAAALAVTMVVPRHAAALVSSSPDPDTWQTNGRVTAIAYLGNTVYIGGSFSAVRPAGVAPGGPGQQTRHNLAAFNATTGALLGWNPDANGSVRALKVSPAGTRIYAGGAFTRAGGAARHRVAALHPTSGAALNWKPYVNDEVKTITTSNSGAHVYIGGDFTFVAAAARRHLASIQASSGKLFSLFKPVVTRDTRFATVLAIDMSKNGKTLYLVGLFTTVKGVGRRNSPAVSTGIATLRPWKPAKTLATATAVEVSAGGTRVFVGGRGPGGYVQSYTTGSAGNPV
jgi:trimeric autotransporter adhesin